MKRIFFIAVMVMWGLACCTLVSAEKKRMVYRLKWKFNTSVAGDIFAGSAGYFKKSGLKVDVKAGGVGINAIRELELGRAQFGVASADQVIQALEKGAKIVVIAQLFQANPLQWIYRAEQPGIERLQDLKGRRIGVTFGGNDEAIMTALLVKGHLRKKDVTILSVQGNALPFFRRNADLWPVYRNSQGVVYEEKLLKQGENVRFVNPRDFGVSFVANSVITTRDMLQKRPRQTASFLEALLTAWQAAMAPENEAPVLDAVKQLDGGINDGIRKKQLAATRELIQPPAGTRIGHIDLAGWEQTETILFTQGQIKKRVHIVDHLVQIK